MTDYSFSIIDKYSFLSEWIRIICTSFIQNFKFITKLYLKSILSNFFLRNMNIFYLFFLIKLNYCLVILLFMLQSKKAL